MIARVKGKLKKAGWMRYIAAFMLPAAVIAGVMIYLGITPFGDKTVLIWDARIQHKDYFGYIWDILHGNASLQYSSGKSLGGRMPGIIAFYSSSPLNLLLLFFKKTQIPAFMSIMIAVKVGLCGFTSYYYLEKRFGTAFFPAVLFSTSYALMEYNVLYCRNIMWLDGVIMLPIAALGVWKLVCEKKQALLWFSVALAIISNWYTGYMVCLFSVFLFAYEYCIYCDFEIFKQFKNTLSACFRYIAAMAGGVMTSMVLLLPALLSLVNGKATHNFSGFTGAVNLSFLHFFSGLDISAAGNSQDAPVIYCGALLVFCVVYYFFDSRNETAKRMLAGLFLLLMVASFCLRDVELAWTAYVRSTSYYFRFSFLFVFLCMMLAADAFAKMRVNGISQKAVIGSLLFVGFAGLYLAFREELPAANIVLVILYGMLISLFFSLEPHEGILHTRLKNKILKGSVGLIALVLLICELSYNTRLAFGEYSDSNKFYASYTGAMENVLDELGEGEDDFYRLEKTYSYLSAVGRSIASCESLLFGYNSIEHYSSAYDEEVDVFLSKMGYSDWVSETVFRTETYWNSPMTVMDSLLSVRYAIMDSESYGYEEYPTQAKLADDTYKVYANRYALPLGFGIKTGAEEEIDYTDNPYRNQELFIKTLTGTDTHIYSFLDGILAEDTGGGIEAWEFKASSDGPVYLYADGTDVHGNYYADNCELYVNGEYVQSICKRFLINSIYLGEYAAGEQITVEIKHLNDDKASHTLYVAQLDTDAFEECIASLRNGQESRLNVNGNVIEGTYSASEDSEMFLTIPYEEGWTAYVDGEKTEIKKTAGIFMGIELTAGEHEIYMKYSAPGYLPGCVFTAIGIAMLAVLVWKERKRCKGANDGEREL